MTNVESQNILLECKDLLVGYGKALPSMKFPFDFSLASGNVVALMGENGCGKSSLLKTFAGLLAPVAGEVSLEGKSLTEWAPRERAQEISLVRMSSAVPPRMSVSEFVSRVFLAEAVAQQVKILLLDEPNAFLDIPRSHALFRLLKKIAVERQMGIVVSTHSVEYAERYCDKIMVVNGGTVKVASAADARKNGLLDWTEICDAL